MRLLVSLLLITGTSVPFQTDAGVPFNGLGGEALMRGISRACRPVTLTTFKSLDGCVDDPFNGAQVMISDGKLPDGYQWGNLVSARWWRMVPDLYGDTVSRDLYNLLPLGSDVVEWRADRPVGEVVTPSYSNALWSAGLGLLGGEEFECYWPPEALRGRLARTYFYMSTLYHADLWAPEAYLMMSSETWPGLSGYAAGMLVDWHRSWPAGADEIRLNELGERLQGNRNPFVDYPELAEYLWGAHKDENFEIEGEPKALKGTYRLSEERIDLYSPYIPSDAVWTVDGLSVDGAWVMASGLGLGMHRLDYSSASSGERGRLTINIVEG